jgi:hypothetical protein
MAHIFKISAPATEDPSRFKREGIECLNFWRACSDVRRGMSPRLGVSQVARLCLWGSTFETLEERQIKMKSSLQRVTFLSLRNRRNSVAMGESVLRR